MHRRVTLAVVAGLGTFVAAAAGCGGGGGGGRGGTAGGFTGFGGFGNFGVVDGGGVSDGGGSTGADVPLQPAPPMCGNGIVETGEACDIAAGCATTQRCSATCTCVAGPPPSNDSGALIAHALADGRIDTFTSLLYRAYRLAGDGRLPTELDGDVTVREDSALFLEVSRLWGSLTPAQQQQLLPYVARPNDPASVYSTPPTAALFDDDLLAAGESDPIQCPVNPQTGAADWRFTEATHFVVWSCGGGNPASDPYAGKRQAAATLADQVWALEVPTMGAPRGDDFPFSPGDKTRIDIYLVPLNKCVRRGDGNLCTALKSDKMIAAAVPDSPCDMSRGALTSSGYAMLRLDLVPDSAPAAGAAAKARSDFAHEFFHLLTYGLNLDAQGGGCRDRKYTGAVIGRTSWLTEASATWAEWAYTPADNPEYRDANFGDYQKRLPAADSLLDNDPRDGANPAYQAFVYPLFLSQEAGGRMPFEDFWKTARGPRTREALDDALNARFPFERHFRDFAVKMLNMTLPGDPLAPLLSAFDSAVPADLPPLNMLPPVTLPDLVTDLPFHVTLAPLAAQVQQLTVGAATRWVDIDLSGAGADLTMDVIANVNGRWTRRDTNGLRFTFCRDEPADDISELYLVIANTAHDDRARADDDYKVKTRIACPASLTGWIRSQNLVTKHYVQDTDTVDQFEQLREIWTLGTEHMIDNMGLQLPGIDSHWQAAFVHHDSTVTAIAGGQCRGQGMYSISDGEGAGSHVTPLVIAEGTGGVIGLSPISPDPGSFVVPMVTVYETCDGNGSTLTSNRTVYEGIFAVAGSLQLTPMPGNPNRYAGSKVLARSETPRNGGSELVEWVISWDIARNRR